MSSRAVACLAIAALACAAPGAGTPDDGAPDDPSRRERLGRRLLEESRRFERDGRYPAAERAARRGLEASPHDAGLYRALARALEAQGRTAESLTASRQADRLDPPPPAPPDVPLELDAAGVVAVLLAPDAAHADPGRLPATWPDEVVAPVLEARLRLRLPGLALVRGDPESVAEAREWLARERARAALSLRVERAFCAETVKDGAFAVGELRAAAGRPGPGLAGAEVVRRVVAEPRLPGDCRAEAVARALELALERPAVIEALGAPPLPPGPDPPGSEWSREAIRALFPGLGEQLAAELEGARRWIASGHLSRAAEALGRAARIDPDDPDLRTHLDEVGASLALAGELSPGDPDALDPRLSPAQRSSVEARLAEERRLQEDLLVALAVLDEDERSPSPSTLRRLRPVEIRNPEDFGPALARSRAGGEVEARAAYAPDGSVLSVYFFARGEELPLLRQEDSVGDGRPDRWIGYEAGLRREVWEDGAGRGRPDIRVEFLPGSREIVQIEYDDDADGRVDRRSFFRRGRLLRREILAGDGP